MFAEWLVKLENQFKILPFRRGHGTGNIKCGTVLEKLGGHGVGEKATMALRPHGRNGFIRSKKLCPGAVRSRDVRNW